VLPGDGIFQVW